MAAPRYGPTLYVADLDRGVVSALDTDTLGVTRTKRVDLGPPGSAPARMTVSADGETLFVTTASGVVSLSTATFDVTGTWTPADPVSGLGVSSDGSLLYVALPTGVEQIDLATGTT